MTDTQFTASGLIEITVPSDHYPGHTTLVGYAIKSADSTPWGAYTITPDGCSLTEHTTADDAIQAVQAAYLAYQAATTTVA